MNGNIREPVGSREVTAQREKRGAEVRVTSAASVKPRLVTVKQAAIHMGVSPSIITGYLRYGVLRRVVLRSPESASVPIRRTLIDINDLEAFIERCKREE